MPLFETSRPSITKLLILVLLSLMLMAFDRAGSTWATRIDRGLGNLTDGITRLLHAPGQFFQDWSQDLQTRAALSAKVDRLKQDNLLLKGQMQRYFALQNEVRQLRQLVHGKEQLDQNVLLARRIGRNPMPERMTFTINRSIQDGVSPGQPVIDGSGLVGQVLRSTMAGATVIELTSKHHAVSVKLADTGFVGVLKGTGQRDKLTLARIPDRYAVHVGDLLTTSGLDGVFPRGYPVARITQVNDDKRHAFINVVARPLAHLDKLDLVLVLSSPVAHGPPASGENAHGAVLDHPAITPPPPARSDNGHARQGTDHAR